MVGDELAVEEAPDQPESFVEPIESSAWGHSEIEAKRFVLALHVSRAHAQHEPPVGDVVEGRGELGDVARIAECHGRHEDADAWRLGQRRERRQRRPAFELGLSPVAGIGQQMILCPERVQTGPARRRHASRRAGHFAPCIQNTAPNRIRVS